MALTFLDLQNELAGSKAGMIVDPSDKTRLMRVLNKSAEKLWNLENWTFRRGVALVTVTGGSSAVTGLPTDLGMTTGLRRDDGEPLRYVEPLVFDDIYYDTVTPVGDGTPFHYTVDDDGAVKVGPPAQSDSTTYKLNYLKSYTAMSADEDEPGAGAWPDDFRLTIALDAQVTWLKRTHAIYVWQPIQDDVAADLDGMRRRYLTNVRGKRTQSPAYRLGT